MTAVKTFLVAPRSLTFLVQSKKLPGIAYSGFPGDGIARGLGVSNASAGVAIAVNVQPRSLVFTVHKP